MSGSPVSATVVGGENMSANLKRVLSVKGKAILARANAANAKQFAALVRQAVPQDPKEQKHLVDTVEQGQVGEVGAQVSIGNEDVSYPLHLETGHRDRAGNNVAARAYWFPAKRVVQKQIRARTLRSYRAAIKAAFPKPSEGS